MSGTEDYNPPDWTIVVYHPFNHEQKAVPVETITRTYISIRWGQSGLYDLNLKDNILTSRSAAARRRAPCLWKALEIEVIREKVKIHFAKQDIKAIVKVDTVKHNATMPKYHYGKRR